MSRELAQKLLDGMKVVDEAAAEDTDYIVCSDAGHVREVAIMLRRDLTGHIEEPCCKCGTKLLVSPQAPKKPKRICTDCAMDTMKPDDLACVSEKIRDAVRAELKKGLN